MQNYISKSEKINYCVGLSGQNLVYSLVGASFFTYFMTDIAMFPAIIVSVLLIIMKVWDGLNDPVVGSFIDKHTFKNGEKMRPFLRYTPLPVGVFSVLLFLVFSTEESLLWLRVAYFVIMYICWDLAYTVQDVSIWGITAMVTPNADERDKFVQWARTIGSVIFAVFSTLLPMALEMVVHASGQSWQFITLVFAVIFGLGGAMISKRADRTKERVRVIQETKQESLAESFSLLFKNRILLLVTLANLLGSLGFGINLVTYFFKYEISSDFLGNGLIGALGLSTLFYVITGAPGFIGMVFADKLKKLFKDSYIHVLIFMQFFNSFFRIIAFLIGFEGKNLWISMAVMGIASLPTGVNSIAQTSLFCDSIDYTEWKTGKRTEGITFSMQTSFTKISSGITAGLATLALSVLNYQAVDNAAVYVGTQSAAFDKWIWPLVVLTPAVANLLYIVPLLFVRYGPKERARVTADLIARRECAEKSENASLPDRKDKDIY